MGHISDMGPQSFLVSNVEQQLQAKQRQLLSCGVRWGSCSLEAYLIRCDTKWETEAFLPLPGQTCEASRSRSAEISLQLRSPRRAFSRRALAPSCGSGGYHWSAPRKGLSPWEEWSGEHWERRSR